MCSGQYSKSYRYNCQQEPTSHCGVYETTKYRSTISIFKENVFHLPYLPRLLNKKSFSILSFTFQCNDYSIITGIMLENNSSDSHTFFNRQHVSCPCQCLHVYCEIKSIPTVVRHMTRPQNLTFMMQQV